MILESLGLKVGFKVESPGVKVEFKIESPFFKIEPRTLKVESDFRIIKRL